MQRSSDWEKGPSGRPSVLLMMAPMVERGDLSSAISLAVSQRPLVPWEAIEMARSCFSFLIFSSTPPTMRPLDVERLTDLLGSPADLGWVIDDVLSFGDQIPPVGPDELSLQQARCLSRVSEIIGHDSVSPATRTYLEAADQMVEVSLGLR